MPLVHVCGKEATKDMPQKMPQKMHRLTATHSVCDARHGGFTEQPGHLMVKFYCLLWWHCVVPRAVELAVTPQTREMEHTG